MYNQAVLKLVLLFLRSWDFYISDADSSFLWCHRILTIPFSCGCIFPFLVFDNNTLSYWKSSFLVYICTSCFVKITVTSRKCRICHNTQIRICLWKHKILDSKCHQPAKWLNKWVVSDVFHVWSKMGVVYNINEARQLLTISKISTGYRFNTGSIVFEEHSYSHTGFFVPQLSCSNVICPFELFLRVVPRNWNWLYYIDSRVLKQFKSRNNWISAATIHHKPTFGSSASNMTFLLVNRYSFIHSLLNDSIPVKRGRGHNLVGCSSIIYYTYNHPNTGLLTYRSDLVSFGVVGGFGNIDIGSIWPIKIVFAV